MLIKSTILMLASVLFVPSINATELLIPGHREISSDRKMPKHGDKMTLVADQFGEPNKRLEPIGEPPITEWIYDSFRVYFESNTVIHSIDLETLIIPSE